MAGRVQEGLGRRGWRGAMAGVQAPRCSAGPSTEARRLPAQQQRGAARCAAAKPVGSRRRRPAHSDALLSGCERRTWLPLSALHFELVRALWGGPEAASRGAGSWAPGVSRRVWMRGEGSTGRRVRAGETWGRRAKPRQGTKTDSRRRFRGEGFGGDASPQTTWHKGAPTQFPSS